MISTSVNNPQTLALLSGLCSLVHTKLLLIDLAGVSFNVGQHFYQHLSKLHLKNPQFISNLLILTAISDNYRPLLNKLLFTPLIWNATHSDADIRLENILTKLFIYNNSNDLKCPPDTVSVPQNEKVNSIHKGAGRDNSWIEQICRLEQNTFEAFITDCLKWSTGDQLTTNLMVSLNKWCDLQERQQASLNKDGLDRTLLGELKNVMDFINFYDYLIDQLKRFIVQNNYSYSSPSPGDSDDDIKAKERKSQWNLFDKNEHNWHLWSINYNFIVLEVLTKSKLPVQFPQSFRKMEENFTDKYVDNRHISNKTIFEAHSTLRSSSAGTESGEQFLWRPAFYLARDSSPTTDGLNSDMNYITYRIEQSSRGQSLSVWDSWRLPVNDSSSYWHCGVLCWSIIGISVTVIFLAIVVSVVTVISLR